METKLPMNSTVPPPPAEHIVILESCPALVVRMPLAIQQPAQPDRTPSSAGQKHGRGSRRTNRSPAREPVIRMIRRIGRDRQLLSKSQSVAGRAG